MRYFYDLPESSIALHPAETRGKSKLVTMDGRGSLEVYPHFDDGFTDLFSDISDETHIVFNDSRVVKARCVVTSQGGSTKPIEVRAKVGASDEALHISRLLQGNYTVLIPFTPPSFRLSRSSLTPL